MIARNETHPVRPELTGAQRRHLAQRLERARQAGPTQSGARPSIPRRPAGAETPLSFAQERLWFLDQLEPGTAVYTVCQAVRLAGPLDVPRLELACNEVIRRHEILRTSFVATAGLARQVIAAERRLAIARIDLAGWSDATRGEELNRLLQEEARQPFDLARGPLLRVLVVRLGATEHLLMLTMHHIISDGWSLDLLFRELAECYGAYTSGTAPALPELPIQFADFVRWEREQLQGAALEQPLAYWRQQLAGPLPVLELPADHPPSVAPTARGATRALTLPPALSQAVQALGQQEGATLFMTLLAAFQILLCRWADQEEIVVGSVVAGRRKVEVEHLIGFFVNTLVLRGDLRGNPTFREFLARVRETTLAALAHQDLPFDRLVKELRPTRTPGRNPFFQVMFVLQHASPAPSAWPQLRLEPVEIDTGTTKFDLTLSVAAGPSGLRATLEYNADRYEAGTMARLLACFQTLLAGLVAHPDQRLSRLPLLTPAERHQLLSDWNPAPADYPRDRTIAQLFAEQAALTPDAVALEFQGRELTYRALAAQAGRLASRLQQAGVGPHTLVGVCAERSLELIVALLGTLQAGGAYVALDPSYPPERLALLLADAQCPVLLTQRALREKFPPHPARVILLDADEPDAPPDVPSPVPGATALPPAGPTAPAYVSYTSGTTGRPKGVCVPHRGVVRLVRNTNYARFTREDVFLQFAPLAFDASTLEIWGALLNGARLVIFPPGPASLADLGAVIRDRGVTTLWLTAGLFHQMIEHEVESLHQVRQLLAGGDVLSPPHVTRALACLPRTQLINGYGPTENTTFTCCHRLAATPPAGRSIPIGRPVAHTQVYLLDRELQPVPIGVPGELCTSGDGLAIGYLNLPGLTREKFLPHPFAADPGARLYRTGDRARWLPDGSIEFLGRSDRQAKIHGFRVEPAEVEAVLATHPQIRECTVVVRADAAGGKSLAAFVVPRELPAPTAEAWRTFLAERIPDHLVPSTFTPLAALPLHPNGKVDPARLPLPEGHRPELAVTCVPPRDEFERQVADIWTEVLGVHPIGVHDGFFDLGGHSLLAVRMVARLQQQFGRQLPVAAIFQHPTIDRLVPLLRPHARRYASGGSIVEIQGAGRQPPVYFVHGVGGGMFWGYANLARHLGPERPVFAFKSRGLEGLPEWGTIEELAAHYLADLRAHRPRGPYLIGGYCFGGVVAFEMARQLAAQGEPPALLALVNCTPPNSAYGRPGSRWSPAWQLRFGWNAARWLGGFLTEWSMPERLAFLRWKFGALRRRATGQLLAGSKIRVVLHDVHDLPASRDYSDRQRDLWQAHVRSLLHYQPRPYAGRVTLFTTRGHSLLSTFDARYGWGEYAAGGVDVQLMPGGHGNILDEPHVRTVARAFAARLAALPAAPTAP